MTESVTHLDLFRQGQFRNLRYLSIVAYEHVECTRGSCSCKSKFCRKSCNQSQFWSSDYVLTVLTVLTYHRWYA